MCYLHNVFIVVAQNMPVYMMHMVPTSHRQSTLLWGKRWAEHVRNRKQPHFVIMIQLDLAPVTNTTDIQQIH